MRASEETNNFLFVLVLALLLVLVVVGGSGWFIWQRQRLVAMREMAIARQAMEEAKLRAEQQQAIAERQLATAEQRQADAELRSAAAGSPGRVDGLSPADDAAEASSRQAVRTIRAVLDAQQIAWNEGDIERFMEGYWKSDQLTFSSGGKTTQSWRETLDNYRRKYPSRSEMGQLTFSDVDIEPLGVDAALALGEWQLARERESLGGNFSLVFRRLNEKWVIVHDHTSLVVQP